jgi:hypothetical protein
MSPQTMRDLETAVAAVDGYRHGTIHCTQLRDKRVRPDHLYIIRIDMGQEILCRSGSLQEFETTALAPGFPEWDRTTVLLRPIGGYDGRPPTGSLVYPVEASDNERSEQGFTHT